MIKVKRQRLGLVASFEYLGVIVSDCLALSCHVHVSVCLWLVGLNSRVTEGNVGL